MKVGDLVRFKPIKIHHNLGIIITIVDQYFVGVVWSGSDFVYLETIESLEVVSEGG